MKIQYRHVKDMALVTELKSKESTRITTSWKIPYTAAKRRLERAGIKVIESEYDVEFEVN
jgi:hypothetical protein